MSTISQEESLLLQCLATTSLLGELSNANFLESDMKVVSEILGHYSEEFTNEVYVIHKPEVIIYDTSEVMNSFIESLKLDSTERTIPVYDISFIQEYLF